MAPPMAPPSNGYDSERSRRESYTSDSDRSSRNGSRWDSSSARSDSESDVPKKSLKSRLGVPKKKNERTGITITLSRSKDEKRSDRRRKRSYDAESDTSEVSSSTDKDIDYRRIKGGKDYYEDSDTESVRSDATTSSRHSHTS